MIGLIACTPVTSVSTVPTYEHDISDCHNGRVTMLFCDGHSESPKESDWTEALDAEPPLEQRSPTARGVLVNRMNADRRPHSRALPIGPWQRIGPAEAER